MTETGRLRHSARQSDTQADSQRDRSIIHISIQYSPLYIPINLNRFRYIYSAFIFMRFPALKKYLTAEQTKTEIKMKTKINPNCKSKKRKTFLLPQHSLPLCSPWSALFPCWLLPASDQPWDLSLSYLSSCTPSSASTRSQIQCNFFSSHRCLSLSFFSVFSFFRISRN